MIFQISRYNFEIKENNVSSFLSLHHSPAASFDYSFMGQKHTFL